MKAQQLLLFVSVFLTILSNGADEQLSLRFQNGFPRKKKTTKDVNKFLKKNGLLLDVYCVNVKSFHPVQKYKKHYVWNPKYKIPTFVIEVVGTKCEKVKDYVYENQLTLKGKKYYIVKDTCEICLDVVNEGMKINILNCHPSHMFCEKCIPQFRNECCPTCRTSITRQSQIKAKLLLIADETIFIPVNMGWALVWKNTTDFSYFIQTFDHGFEYASYKRIINSLILNFFIPTAYLWLEILAKKYSKDMLVDLNDVDKSTSILYWHIFSFFAHHINKRLGFQLSNEKFLAAVFLSKMVPSLLYPLLVIAGAAGVNSLLNSARNCGRPLSFVVHITTITIFLAIATIITLLLILIAVGLGYFVCETLYQMISVETLYFVISILKKVPRLPFAFYRVFISLISNNDMRSMYGETTLLHKKPTAKPSSNHEISNNVLVSLKELSISSIMFGCVMFVFKNHGKTFESIIAKIFQIITTIRTIFLENLIRFFHIIPNFAI